MALKATLPAPPADLSARPLPLVTVEGPLYRIHRRALGWRHFGRGISERFDDPRGGFGVLYAASEPDAAFAEVFLRQLSLMVVAEADLLARSLTCFAAERLRCVDLTGAGLRRLSCDNRISTEKPYRATGMWSRAFYTHPEAPDGLLYRSRHNPGHRCVALFDRCEGRLSAAVSEDLMGAARRAWTAAQLHRYRLALV